MTELKKAEAGREPVDQLTVDTFKEAVRKAERALLRDKHRLPFFCIVDETDIPVIEAMPGYVPIEDYVRCKECGHVREALGVVIPGEFGAVGNVRFCVRKEVEGIYVLQTPQLWEQVGI